MQFSETAVKHRMLGGAFTPACFSSVGLHHSWFSPFGAVCLGRCKCSSRAWNSAIFLTNPSAGFGPFCWLVPTCRCWGWTFCPAAGTTLDSPCTDTDRCRGLVADFLDTVPRTHSRTAPHPTAVRRDTISPALCRRTGIHLWRGESSTWENKTLDIKFCTSVAVVGLNMWWSSSDLLLQIFV